MSISSATSETRDPLNLRIEPGLAAEPEILALWNRIGAELGSCMTHRQLTHWAEPIAEFARLSPALAQRYLAAGRIATKLTATEIDCWTGILKNLANRGWKSTRLACDLLDTSETLMAAGGFDSLRKLAGLLAQIADQSVELAASCLDSACGIFAAMSGDKLNQFLSLAKVVAVHDRGDMWKYFERGNDLFSPFGADASGRFALLSEELLRNSGVPSISLVEEIANAMRSIPADDHGFWFDQAQRIADLDTLAAAEFLKAAPRLHRTLRTRRISAWVDRGIESAHEVPDADRAVACQAFFRRESTSADKALSDLSERVEYSQVERLLQLYGQALAGESVVVRPRECVSPDDSLPEARVIPVPDYFDAFESREENLGAYKACIAHRAGRLLFSPGEVPFALNRRAGAPGTDDSADTALAQNVFALVEDGRVDAIIHQEYPGLAPSLARLKTHALAGRPSPDKLALRQAFLENLLRTTLDAVNECCWPVNLTHIMATAIGVLRIATRDNAATADATDVSLWLYRLAGEIPNVENAACPRPWRTLADSDIPSFNALPLLPSLPHWLLNAGPVCAMTDTGIPEFRGAFMPPVAASVSMPLPAGLNQDAADALIQEATPSDDDDATDSLLLRNDSDANDQPGDDDATGQDGQDEDAIIWHHYDEWDCHIHGYRTDWCRVGERPVAAGDPSVYTDILSRRHGLIAAIRRQFELMRPEYQRKVRNLHDGHDIDLEQAIRFIVDKKAGTGPVARFYTRRDKIERDVAAAFLIDMSHSTDEKITLRDDTRIIDVERDASVLIMEAMEAIGDTYGVFGFSGHGRDNVAYYTIKALDEALSTRVKQRIGGITPLGATRMGAAIRHTRALLEQTSCTVRLLILVSDGRPQDREYGDANEPAGYGVHDTRQALVETARAGMVPFVITIDRQGPDYLETMCADIGYEVVEDVTALPSRLPALYRYLAGK